MTLGGLGKALNLREGEGRTLASMGAFLFLNTANTTVLSAAKNGLFLSVYGADLIPYAVISAAALTAVVGILFTGVISGTARRSLAVWLTVFLTVSLVVSRVAFGVDPEASFGLYLWLSAVQVLIITHAWDYVGDLLTGRQAKRILPLVGMGASAGAILGGGAVAPIAFSLGTEELLVVSIGLLLAALPFLWTVPEPGSQRHGAADEDALDVGAVGAFVEGAFKGFRTLGREPLLRLLAVGLVALTLTGTLVDLQLKFALQESFTRDGITAFYGAMSAVVGFGTLALQFWASRFLFPKMGVSFAALLQAGTLSVAAGGVAVAGGVFALAGLQALDDILQFSLQKPVEQVSLLPFTGPRKSAAIATLGGVLRPASKAAAGALALLWAGDQGMLPLATVAAALVAFVAYTRHRTRYLAALEGALVRHTVDFRVDTPLVLDRGALAAIERGLEDEDSTVVVFAVSLLPQLPESDALPRVFELLVHPAPEVRAEAALVLGQMDVSDPEGPEKAIRARLRGETSPFVLSSLLRTAGRAEGIVPEDVEAFTTHEEGKVRAAALIALGHMGWPPLELRLRRELTAGSPAKRASAATAVGRLGLTDLMEEVAAGVEDPETRPACLGALSQLGESAVPVLARLLRRRDLPLPSRRSVVTALASIDTPAARSALLGIIVDPALGPPALTSLHRMRKNQTLDPVNPARFRPTLDAEIRTGLRYALLAGAVRDQAAGERAAFVVSELEGLRMRSLIRVLRILALCYDPAHMSAVEVGLTSGDVARRSHALELLEGAIAPSVARSVMPFAEATSEGFAVHAVSSLLDDAAGLMARPLETLATDTDWWPRALGLYGLHRDDEITTPGRNPDEHDEEADMIPLIEKVMILKGSQLFESFPGNDLAGIASLAGVVHLREGDVVFDQGDPGDAFYMVVRGAVRITRGNTELALLGPRQGFGELAILDDEARSAKATASEATTLLRIDRQSFDRLIDQNPAVARGIYRVLSRRLRNMLAQVAAG